MATDVESIHDHQWEPAETRPGRGRAGLVLERGNVRLEQHRGDPFTICKAATRIGECLEAVHLCQEQSLGRITSASFASFPSSHLAAPAWKVSNRSIF